MKIINEPMQYYAALGFYKEGKLTALRLKGLQEREIYEIIPTAAVCYSFAAELFLKLLFHLVFNKPAKNQHRLKVLFSKLPRELQDEVKKKYDLKKDIKSAELLPFKCSFNSYSGNPQDQDNSINIEELTLDSLLEIHNDSFRKWRYLFEITNEYYSYEYNFKLMDDFINSLLEVIKEYSAEKADKT